MRGQQQGLLGDGGQVLLAVEQRGLGRADELEGLEHVGRRLAHLGAQFPGLVGHELQVLARGPGEGREAAQLRLKL